MTEECLALFSFGRGRRSRGGSRRRCWRWRIRYKHFLRGVGYLVGMGDQLGRLPHLGIRQFGFEAWHSRKPDAVGHLPITLRGWIVGHALSMEQLRRDRIHSFLEDGL